MFKSSTFLLVLIIVVVLAVGSGFGIIYSKFFSKSSVVPTFVSPSLSTSPSVSVSPSSITTVKIISFSIEPSIKDGGWIMYRNGAKVVLVGKNIKSATVMTVPSGTEIDKATKLGEMVKTDENRWEFLLPKFLLVTNFWAEATGFDNSVVKSYDLGNIGYEE